jgi:hypothetical protein
MYFTIFQVFCSLIFFWHKFIRNYNYSFYDIFVICPIQFIALDFITITTFGKQFELRNSSLTKFPRILSVVSRNLTFLSLLAFIMLQSLPQSPIIIKQTFIRTWRLEKVYKLYNFGNED